MLAILLLATSAFAGNVPTADVDDFFDAVLRQAAVTPRRQLQNYQFSAPLGVTVGFSNIDSQGPTFLKRHGSTEGTQSSDHARTSGVVSLGQLGYGVQKAKADLFGHNLSIEILLLLKDAYSSVELFVAKDGNGNCQVSARVDPPYGTYMVQLETQGALPKWFTSTLEQVLSFALQYVPLPFVNRQELFSDITNHIEKHITIAALEMSCGSKQ